MELGQGRAGRLPRLEPARCTMELGHPGMKPLLQLLLLLGASLLPGEFQGAGRAPFCPFQGCPGPPAPEEGRLLTAVPNHGCAQPAATEAPSPPRSIGCLRFQLIRARKGLTRPNVGIGIWVVRGAVVSATGLRSSNLGGEKQAHITHSRPHPAKVTWRPHVHPCPWFWGNHRGSLCWGSSSPLHLPSPWQPPCYSGGVRELNPRPPH